MWLWWCFNFAYNWVEWLCWEIFTSRAGPIAYSYCGSLKRGLIKLKSSQALGKPVFDLLPSLKVQCSWWGARSHIWERRREKICSMNVKPSGGGRGGRCAITRQIYRSSRLLCKSSSWDYSKLQHYQRQWYVPADALRALLPCKSKATSGKENVRKCLIQSRSNNDVDHREHTW